MDTLDSVVPFGVLFDKCGVFLGNELHPAQMAQAPTFFIGTKTDQLFTIVISSLDSNYIENGKSG